MATKWSQQLKPLAARSARCCRTAWAKVIRSMSVRICAKQLATATITHLRLVGGTAQTRRGRVVVNSPSYSQAEGIFRTYFGQEWLGSLCFTQIISMTRMLAGFAGLYEAPLPALLLNVDTIEGKLPRRDGRDSDKTDHMTMENVLWGHGGLVTGHNKGLPCFVPLQGP